jgi:DNA-binding transcriptional LysR family regulator
MERTVNLETVNLDAIRCFVVFSDTLNFTHAADQLHISQPALHVKVNELGAMLGVTLYRRIGRKLELTENGKKVARFGREIGERTESFLHELSSGTATSQVSLAAGEGAYLYLLAEGIKEFLRRSNVSLNLLTLNREGIIDAVESGKAHLGVASLDSIPPGFESAVLRRVGQVLVMPGKHALAGKKTIKLSDLSGRKLIVPPPDRPHRQVLAGALQSAGVEWQVAVEAHGWELMHRFVQLGMGLAIVNGSCTIPRGLVARPVPSLPQIHYHLFHLAGAASHGAVAELKTVLLNSIQAR